MDDNALRPSAPLLKAETAEEQDALASQLDRQTAEAYFHPAWARVEEMFRDAIETCDLPVNPQLPADEYKIESLSDQRLKLLIKGVIQRVQDAVQAVEQSGTSKRRNKGGK